MCPPLKRPGGKGHIMKIRLRYDNQTTYIDVPEEDFTLMIKTDYDERCAAADDPSTVSPRSPQEIIEEHFNRPDYNNWRRHWRHTEDNAIPRRLDHKVGFIGHRPDDLGVNGERSHFDIDAFPDTAGLNAVDWHDSYQEQCAMLRRVLKPSYAETIIAIHLDGFSLNEYADMTGDNPNNVSHRLKRAEKKLKDILEKCPI